MQNFMNKIKNFFTHNEILSLTDFKIIGILTLIFTVLAFFRLGNMYAPQTVYETNEEHRDFIIDFGDYITVNQLHVYLGYEANRNISLSAFNEVTGEWQIINSENNVGSVFQWNTVDIYYNLRYLGIVATDEMAAFNEFVFTGPDGVITPVNIDQYPELFDEQDMFYTTDEKTYMDGTMFDEVYHGRTGYEFIHQLPTYETTHPQLGKCFIALGILLFGMTPFGWRFFVVIFGIMFIPLMYIFAKKLFNNTYVATAVGIFITFDCMHYTLSRIATIDIFVAFFIVLSYYYMYSYLETDTLYRTSGIMSCIRKASKTQKALYSVVKPDDAKFPPFEVYYPLAMCGVFMGCAISTKLTGVYAGVGLAIILAVHLIKYWPKKQAMRLFWFCVAFFIVIPLILYTLAYIPTYEKYAHMGYTDKSITLDENGLNIGYGWTGLIARTLRNTNYMINYHKNLEATHYYGSPFYEWPIVWMPLLAANDNVSVAANSVSAVSYIGNVLIWWVGFPCLLFTTAYGVIKKDKKALFIIVAYLAQYIPWMKVDRVTFIYHYLPSILFTMFAMGYVIEKLTSWNKSAKKIVNMYLALVVIVFFIFFPVISGMPINKDYGLALRWLPDWILVL